MQMVVRGLGRGVVGGDSEQRRARLHPLAVFDPYFHHHAVHRTGQIGEHLHCFQQGQRLTDLDSASSRSNATVVTGADIPVGDIKRRIGKWSDRIAKLQKDLDHATRRRDGLIEALAEYEIPIGDASAPAEDVEATYVEEQMQDLNSYEAEAPHA